MYLLFNDVFPIITILNVNTEYDCTRMKQFSKKYLIFELMQ